MKSNLSRIAVIMAVVVAGVWLVGRGVSPAAESSARLAALRQAAPGPRVHTVSARWRSSPSADAWLGGGRGLGVEAGGEGGGIGAPRF